MVMGKLGQKQNRKAGDIALDRSFWLLADKTRIMDFIQARWISRPIIINVEQFHQ